MSGPFIDISGFQSLAIDFAAYRTWSAAGDGVSRLALKSTEGVGFTDPHFHAFRDAALAAGIDSLLIYHYGRPDLGNTAQEEADYQRGVVGALRPSDALCLDLEVSDPRANAAWAASWLARQEASAGQCPALYCSDTFARVRMQDGRLARYPLWDARWTYDPNARPACPPPWASYMALQYSDKISGVPGVPGTVDGNMFIGTGNFSGGGVMTTLPGFPMLSQRDGDANQDFDCVPASIAACMAWLMKKPYTAKEIKDAVYGAAYTGGTGASAYVDYCKARGVALLAVDGTGTQLVQDLRAAIAAGHPCLITEPDPYAAGWTHVCAAYGFDASGITVMDPWIDQPVTKSNAQWAAQLQDNQIWRMEKIMGVPQGWKDNGTTLTAPNGLIAVRGFRAHILSAAWDSGNVPLDVEIGLPQVELHNAALGSGTQQLFRDCQLVWTQATGVLVSYTGMELFTALGMIRDLQAQIAALKAIVPPDPGKLAAVIAQIKALVSGV